MEDVSAASPRFDDPADSIWYHRPSVLRFALMAFSGLAADLSVKHWAGERLSNSGAFGPRPVIHLLPGWVDLEWTYNHGAALGSFQGYRWMFLGVSVIAIAFLCYLFTAARRSQWFYQIMLGMLLAGVIGNMYDRVMLGAVRDMIHALPDRHWPDLIASHLPAAWGGSTELFPWIFNIADSLLCVGVGLMLVYSFFYPAERVNSQATAH